MDESKKEIQKKLQPKAPTIIIVFGATGDLSQGKLFPSLLDLFAQNLLPKTFKIIGFAFDKMDDRAFRVFVRNAVMRKRKKHSRKIVNAFLDHVHFQQGNFEDVESFHGLAHLIIEQEKDFGHCANKFMYFAIPPRFYECVLDNLAASGLTITCSSKGSWNRVLIEKPFGKDQKSATELNKKLKLLFNEDQIFRIDHYLAKETVQNILSFRFSNRLFESIWDRSNIESIEIKLREKKGVAGRGGFYDDTGALRDVGQNHILQLLALMTMENPGEFDAGRIQQERAKVLEKLVRITPKNAHEKVVRGQYKGFKKHKGVDPNSETETYFRIKAQINNQRWKGVTMLLESGKELNETKTKITVYLKQAHCLCPPNAIHPHQNRIVFRIQPNEGITVVFWVKKTGFTTELEEKKLTFYYNESDSLVSFPDAYEKVLYDTLRGDQTLFASTREVDASWKFIDSVRRLFSHIPLHEYEENTRGPQEN